jgi:hypothetical protein
MSGSDIRDWGIVIQQDPINFMSAHSRSSTSICSTPQAGSRQSSYLDYPRTTGHDLLFAISAVRCKHYIDRSLSQDTARACSRLHFIINDGPNSMERDNAGLQSRGP